MERLSRQQLETIIHQLLVFIKDRSFQNTVTSIAGIAKQGVSYSFQMGTYLMGAPSLQPTFDQGHIAQPFQYLIVCDRPLAFFGIIIEAHDSSIPGIPSDVSGYCSIFSNISPYQSDITALYRMFKKLLGKIGHRPLVLSYNQ